MSLSNSPPSLLRFASACYSSTNTVPHSAEVALQQLLYSPLAEEFTPKEAFPLPSSSTTSPWDVPDDPMVALKPAAPRAQSAPISRPPKLLDSSQGPGPASPPKSVDAFTTLSWSQSQWIAFNEKLGPSRRTVPGLVLKELPRLPSIAPTTARPVRFFSDDPADPVNRVGLCGGTREDSAPFGWDVSVTLGGRGGASAPAPHGNAHFDGCHGWLPLFALTFDFLVLCFIL